MSFWRNTGPSLEQKAKVCERAGGCCERCGRDLEGQRYSIHHRKPRRMGGTKDPEINSLCNLMLLCGTGTTGCHGYVEDRRLEAMHLGYLLASWEDPSGAVVHVHGRGSCYLLADGTYQEV